jgi:hypothetical protein
VLLLLISRFVAAVVVLIFLDLTRKTRATKKIRLPHLHAAACTCPKCGATFDMLTAPGKNGTTHPAEIYIPAEAKFVHDRPQNNVGEVSHDDLDPTVSIGFYNDPGATSPAGASITQNGFSFSPQSNDAIIGFGPAAPVPPSATVPSTPINGNNAASPQGNGTFVALQSPLPTPGGYGSPFSPRYNNGAATPMSPTQQFRQTEPKAGNRACPVQ